MQYNGDVPYLGCMQFFLRDKFKPILRISDAINSTFKTWKAFLFTSRIFTSAKKVLKTFMYSIRNILFYLGEYFRVQTCEKVIKIVSVECHIVFFVDRYGKFKKFIIDVFADIKRVKKYFFLFLRRIQTVFIHPEFHIKDMYIYGSI